MIMNQGIRHRRTKGGILLNQINVPSFFIDLSYQLHKNKNCTVIVPYIIDNHSFLPFISLSLLGIIYVTLSTIADTVHVPTHILQSNIHSNEFVQVSFNCMSPLSRGSCS